MTHSSPEPVVSAVPYVVQEVDGHEPTSLDDFIGSVRVTVRGPTGVHVLVGEGSLVDDVPRIHEKSVGSGKDVRTWHVRRTRSGGFLAATV